jgi:hypothetical protein
MIARIFFYVLLAASCTACAHMADVKTKPSLTATQESPEINATDDNDTFNPSTLDDYPDLTPEEMGNRFLKLLSSIDSVDELSWDYVHKIMRLPVKGKASHSYDFGMYLPESGWSYIFSYDEAPIDDAPKQEQYKTISFEFNNPDSPGIDTAPICGKNFDAYVTELKKMGFVIGPEMIDMGSHSIHTTEDSKHFIEWNIFRSSVKTGLLGLSGSIVEQRQERSVNEIPKASCLKSIYFSGKIKP